MNTSEFRSYITTTLLDAGIGHTLTVMPDCRVFVDATLQANKLEQGQERILLDRIQQVLSTIGVKISNPTTMVDGCCGYVTFPDDPDITYLHVKRLQTIFPSADFSVQNGRIYMRWDTGDSTTQENEREGQLINEDFSCFGYNFVDRCIEHDCISGFIDVVTRTRIYES